MLSVDPSLIFQRHRILGGAPVTGGLKEDGSLPDWVTSRLNLGAQILEQQGELPSS